MRLVASIDFECFEFDITTRLYREKPDGGTCSPHFEQHKYAAHTDPFLRTTIRAPKLPKPLFPYQIEMSALIARNKARTAWWQ